MIGVCPACEISSAESACFVCGGGLLYGVVLKPDWVSSHHHDPNRMKCGFPLRTTPMECGPLVTTLF